MTKILVTGKTGQVGWELQRTLATLGQVIAPDRRGMDLGDPDSIRAAIRACSPQIIVNAAAYTAVDQAESEPDLALAINGAAPGIMAEEAKRLGALLVHYSTDYVFDGAKSGPYTEDDQPNPLSAYGSSKLAGERAIAASGARYLIFRTSWVYGARGKNFLRTILRLAQERDELRIVDDQVGAPTWCRAIAEATAQALACTQARDAPNVSGTYHLSTAGSTSWCGFAKAILERSGRSCKVVPIASSEYPLPARRPRNSVLSNAKLNTRIGIALPDWSSALELCLQQD
jgi:dTDP-4-dehydrorhamnose reductase